MKPPKILLITGLALVLTTAFGLSQLASSEQYAGQTETHLGHNTYKNINADEALEILDNATAEVIDVRTTGESKSGCLKNTSHFIDINSSGFESRLSELDKNKAYLVYCQSGARSGNAMKVMQRLGFKEVYNLSGGMMRWPYKEAVVKPAI